MLWVECELARIQIRTRPSALSFQPCEDYLEPTLPLLLFQVDPLAPEIPRLVTVDVQEFPDIDNSHIGELEQGCERASVAPALRSHTVRTFAERLTLQLVTRSENDRRRDVGLDIAPPVS